MRRFAFLTLLAIALLPSGAAATMLVVGEAVSAVPTHEITADRDGPANAGLEAPSSLSTGIASLRASADSKSGGMRPAAQPGSSAFAPAIRHADHSTRRVDPDIPATCEELPYHATAPPSQP